MTHRKSTNSTSRSERRSKYRPEIDNESSDDDNSPEKENLLRQLERLKTQRKNVKLNPRSEKVNSNLNKSVERLDAHHLKKVENDVKVALDEPEFCYFCFLKFKIPKSNRSNPKQEESVSSLASSIKEEDGTDSLVFE